ncbi:MAG: hypothetical protein ABI194_02245, partial [Gemmatimonadaceae bacterium]
LRRSRVLAAEFGQSGPRNDVHRMSLDPPVWFPIWEPIQPLSSPVSLEACLGIVLQPASLARFLGNFRNVALTSL